MAKKRTKEEKLLRNIQRLEKDVEQALAREPWKLTPEEVKALAASAASDST